jgi:hypothetical protein
VPAFGALTLVAWTSLTLAQDGHTLSGRLRYFFSHRRLAYFPVDIPSRHTEPWRLNLPAFMRNWGFVHNVFV